jgi:hypothetical protein
MAAGITLDESLKIFGSRGKTRTAQMIDAFKKTGIPCASRLTVLPQAWRLPPAMLTSQGDASRLIAQRALLAVKYTQPVPGRDKPLKWGHWVLFWDWTLYDPAASSLGVLFENPAASSKIVSFLNLMPTYSRGYC